MLTQNRQYNCSYGQNTYHKTERGEVPFSVRSNPCMNANRYLNAKSRENVGHSFEHLYDDSVVDSREEFMNRHFDPRWRNLDIERRNSYLFSTIPGPRNKCARRRS